ncbi:MAG: DUF1080 domain-containing protein [Candidatus Rokubacteria bacterium]|nr:DUF1080 domain-containing protein [Candidatus Rokubacteria bacterium]
MRPDETPETPPPAFRFELGERVRVLTHPAQPAVAVLERWPGEAWNDVYDEPIYAVSGFVTRQRESSLAREGSLAIPLDPPTGWRTAGHGEPRRVASGTVESSGGPGIVWYTREAFEDFVLTVDWRLVSPDDNSGVFIRIPPLGSGDPDRDWKPAVDEGYEIQIDDRGVDRDRGTTGSALHMSGAISRRSPARRAASRPVGRWNTFEIEARGPTVAVRLNGVAVSTLDDPHGRRGGHVGLQCHHAGSRVAFRNLQVVRR